MAPYHEPEGGGIEPDPKMQEEPMTKYFQYGHLKEGPLREASKPWCELATLVIMTVPRNAERTVALRKLLEGKDCAVRAMLP